MFTKLPEIFTPENTIIIGSGILEALGIRTSHDVDMVVDQETYETLEKTGEYQVDFVFGNNILHKDNFEIGTGWNVLGHNYTFSDLLPESVIVEGRRYNSLEFLLKVKKSWAAGDSPRQKDVDDVALIEKYLH